jgi:hypothetical protein
MKREILDTVDATLSRFDDEPEVIELAPGADQRDFLEKVVHSPKQPMQRRVKCAEIIMSYKYPKFGAVAIGSISGQDFATMLERAIRNSGKEREVKQIEAKVASDGQGQ